MTAAAGPRLPPVAWPIDLLASAGCLRRIVVVGGQNLTVAGGDRAVELTQPQETTRRHRSDLRIRNGGNRDRPRDVHIRVHPGASRTVGPGDRDAIERSLGTGHRVRDLPWPGRCRGRRGWRRRWCRRGGHRRRCLMRRHRRRGRRWRLHRHRLGHHRRRWRRRRRRWWGRRGRGGDDLVPRRGARRWCHRAALGRTVGLIRTARNEQSNGGDQCDGGDDRRHADHPRPPRRRRFLGGGSSPSTSWVSYSSYGTYGLVNCSDSGAEYA